MYNRMTETEFTQEMSQIVDALAENDSRSGAWTRDDATELVRGDVVRLVRKRYLPHTMPGGAPPEDGKDAHFGFTDMTVNGVADVKTICGYAFMDAEPSQETLTVDPQRVTCPMCNLKMSDVLRWALAHADDIPDTVRAHSFAYGNAF